MDQIKIGKFIAALRKGREWTQLQLAERLGVSDKTVSKWECGKGLPELSMLMLLCDVFDVSVNELLSGERLSSDDYSQKAEENMMTLMQETEDSRKRGRASAVMGLLGIAVIAGFIALTMAFGGVPAVTILDTVSILILFVATTLFLLAAGLWKDFWRGLRMTMSRKAQPSDGRDRAREALALASRTMLFTGIFASILQLIVVLYIQDGTQPGLMYLGKNIAVTLLTVLYGVLTHLLLLPLRSRLDVLSK